MKAKTKQIFFAQEFVSVLSLQKICSVLAAMPLYGLRDVRNNRSLRFICNSRYFGRDSTNKIKMRKIISALWLCVANLPNARKINGTGTM